MGLNNALASPLAHPAAAAACVQFDSTKSGAFICSIILFYANDAPSEEWRRFLPRVLAFISSSKIPSLIHRFIAGLWMLNASGCANRSVLAATLCSPLRAAHAPSLARIVVEFPSPRRLRMRGGD
jgi:hypothetical protein